mgnify:CR=1 FL=1
MHGSNESKATVSDDHSIRCIDMDSGTVSLLAGSSEDGNSDGISSAVSTILHDILWPISLAFDRYHTLFIAASNSLWQKPLKSGMVVTCCAVLIARY